MSQSTAQPVRPRLTARKSVGRPRGRSAEDVIKAQTTEIATLRDWLAKSGK